MTPFTPHRRIRKGRPIRAFILAIAMLAAIPATVSAQPNGFGNAVYLGKLNDNVAGWKLWANDTVRPTPGHITYRFEVASRQSVSMWLTASTKTVAVVLFDSGGRFMLLGGNNDPRINTTLAAGTYYARVIVNPNTTTSYRLDVSGKPVAIVIAKPPVTTTVRTTTPVVLPPKPVVVAAPKPVVVVAQPKPTPKIAYGGFNFDNHSANTTMTPTTINLGGSFTVNSSTMNFGGARVFVTLVDVNRIPGSSGVTRFSLTQFNANGRTLTVAGPNLALFRNRSFYVEISTWENGLPKSYAMPGVLKIQ